MVTLNSDDPAMFLSDLQDEYRLAHESFGFTEEHLRELAAILSRPASLHRRKVALLQQIEQVK